MGCCNSVFAVGCIALLVVVCRLLNDVLLGVCCLLMLCVVKCSSLGVRCLLLVRWCLLVVG